MCADMWSMACFLWTAPNRVAPAADRSKRGRAWAREAADIDPGRLKLEIRVFKLAWESKRQTAYARWVLAEWSLSQWWVEQKKEDATRRGTGAKAQASEGTEGGTGNLVTPGVGNDPEG